MSEYGQDLMSELTCLGVIPCIAIAIILITILILSLKHLARNKDENSATSFEIDMIIDSVVIFLAAPLLISFSAVSLLTAIVKVVMSLITHRQIHWY